MKIAVFSSKAYDQKYLSEANQGRYPLHFFDVRLNTDTAALAQDATVVCCFVNDQLDAATLAKLYQQGTRLVALRCAGFNQVDLAAAKQLGIVVARVPEYSPHAVAEHALGLMLMLNRNLHRAYHRVRENDFALNGLMGFDMVNKCAAIIGTGKIGAVLATILQGLGCKVIAHDPNPDPALVQRGVTYLPLNELWPQADIISLHCPLTPATHHLINQTSIAQMKTGIMLINTGRGGLLDTQAVVAGLKTRQIGYLGLDVYEEEASLFFEDNSNQLLQDDIFARLLTFPNVVITGHQGFFTHEAMSAIAKVTLDNIHHFEAREWDQICQVTA